jgi:hypothetical protein
MLFAVGCKEQAAENRSSGMASLEKTADISISASSCSYLSQADLDRLAALEAALVNHPANPVAIIEEIGRFGCESSAPLLLSIAEDIDSTLTLGSDGVLTLSSADQLAAIFEASTTLLPNGTAFDLLLNKYLNESRPIQFGGRNSLSMSEVARSALAAQNAPQFGLVPKYYAYNPSCSSSYILNDGSVTNYVSDFDAYVSSISQLASDSSVRLAISKANSCNASIQLAALYDLDLGDLTQNLNAISEIADSNRFRGSQVSAYIATRMPEYWLGETPSEADVAAVVDFNMNKFLGGSGQEIFPDELTRKNAVYSLGYICATYRATHLVDAAACTSFYDFIRENTSKKDWARDVRMVALLVPTIEIRIDY